MAGCRIHGYLGQRAVEASRGRVSPNRSDVDLYADLDVTLGDEEGQGERSPSRRSVCRDMRMPSIIATALICVNPVWQRRPADGHGLDHKHSSVPDHGRLTYPAI